MDAIWLWPAGLGAVDTGSTLSVQFSYSDPSDGGGGFAERVELVSGGAVELWENGRVGGMVYPERPLFLSEIGTGPEHSLSLSEIGRFQHPCFNPFERSGPWVVVAPQWPEQFQRHAGFPMCRDFGK